MKSEFPSESVDLVYIDPPFGTQSLWVSRTWGKRVQELGFYDMWGGGIHGYMKFLEERLFEIHRILKPSGSLFLHLDWRASHYARVALDQIFGVKNPASSKTNLINEIVWCYKDVGGGRNTDYYKRKHDTIFWYAKDHKQKKVNQIARNVLSDSTLDRFGSLFDDKGVITYRKLKDKRPQEFSSRKKQGRVPDNLDDVFLSKNFGRQLEDYWTDITPLRRRRQGDNTKEKFRYPTQKPVALLERIIETATNKGDIVLDCFCGCGTTLEAAEKLNRQWIGIDTSLIACKAMEERLKEECSIVVKTISKKLDKQGYMKLDPFEFEREVVVAIGGIPNTQQRGDGGIDGRLGYDMTPIQVKKSEHIGRKVLDEMYKHIDKHGRGIIIALSFGKGILEERDKLEREKGWDIQLLTLKDIIKDKLREHKRLI